MEFSSKHYPSCLNKNLGVKTSSRSIYPA